MRLTAMEDQSLSQKVMRRYFGTKRRVTSPSNRDNYTEEFKGLEPLHVITVSPEDQVKSQIGSEDEESGDSQDYNLRLGDSNIKYSMIALLLYDLSRYLAN